MPNIDHMFQIYSLTSLNSMCSTGLVFVDLVAANLQELI